MYISPAFLVNFTGGVNRLMLGFCCVLQVYKNAHTFSVILRNCQGKLELIVSSFCYWLVVIGINQLSSLLVRLLVQNRFPTSKIKLFKIRKNFDLFGSKLCKFTLTERAVLLSTLHYVVLDIKNERRTT